MSRDPALAPRKLGPAKSNKRGPDELVICTGIASREHSRFKLGVLKGDNFQCRVFKCDLQSSSYSNLFKCLLANIKKKQTQHWNNW